jgi:hypothetical protein
VIDGLPVLYGLHIPPPGFHSQKRKKVIFAEVWINLKKVFHNLAARKAVRLSPATSGRLRLPGIGISPKFAVLAVTGFLKDKSTSAIAGMAGEERFTDGQRLCGIAA